MGRKVLNDEDTLSFVLYFENYKKNSYFKVFITLSLQREKNPFFLDFVLKNGGSQSSK